jgi:hypothetical protein
VLDIIQYLFRFFYDSDVFLGKGNGFRGGFECIEKSKCVPIMSDDRWVNLCKYKQRDRLRIRQGWCFTCKKE